MFQVSLLHCALPSEKRTLFSAGVRNFRTAHYRESNRQLRTLRGKMYVRFVLRERETEFKGSLCNIARSSPVRRLTPAGVAMPYSTAAPAFDAIWTAKPATKRHPKLFSGRSPLALLALALVH